MEGLVKVRPATVPWQHRVHASATVLPPAERSRSSPCILDTARPIQTGCSSARLLSTSWNPASNSHTSSLYKATKHYGHSVNGHNKYYTLSSSSSRAILQEDLWSASVSVFSNSYGLISLSLVHSDICHPHYSQKNVNYIDQCSSEEKLHTKMCLLTRTKDTKAEQYCEQKI